MIESLKQYLESKSKPQSQTPSDGLLLIGTVNLTTQPEERRNKDREVWGVEFVTVVKGGGTLYYLKETMDLQDLDKAKWYEEGQKVRIRVSNIRIGRTQIGVDGSGKRLYKDENVISEWEDIRDSDKAQQEGGKGARA